MTQTRKSIYIETSILSFLCADPSMVYLTARKQEDTQEWWTRHRKHYEVFVSSEVIL